MTELVDTFAALFRGRNDALGTDAGGVLRRTVLKPDYSEHLRGATAIGIFPMLDDNTVWFGAIDLDEPDFELARQMQTLIPGASWIERSRSGNAHVWVFFKSPAPAWVVRTVLRGATEAVGRRDVEVFPKQDQLKPGMVGNYINLPLFGHERPILDPFDKAPITPHDELLNWMYHERQDPADWERRARALGGIPPAERSTQQAWGTAPRVHRCADYIIRRREVNPLLRGHRHVVLFHLSKQLLNWREIDSDTARSYVRLVNEAGEAPISEAELDRLFENAEAGEWTSTGCDEPLMSSYVDPECPIANGLVGR